MSSKIKNDINAVTWSATDQATMSVTVSFNAVPIWTNFKEDIIGDNRRRIIDAITRTLKDVTETSR
jgi:hypothetical protein